MIRKFAALLAVVVLMGATPAATGGQRVFVTLSVAGVEQGEAVVVLSGDDIFAPIGAIENAGVRGFTGTRRTFLGVAYVSLRSLAPNLSYAFDEDKLTLAINVAAALLPKATYDLGAPRPPNLEYLRGSGAFVNYAVSADRGGAANAFLESGYTTPGGLLYTSLTAQSGSASHRGLTYFETDDRNDAIRRTIGDALVSTGDLGGSAFIAGVSVARAFDLDPYAIHFPQPNLSGAVTSPSTADVYVNGVLTNRIPLAPGTFDLSRIPVANGSTTTTVVVTDAFGRSQTYQQGYYAASSLLDPGTDDFAFGAGALRVNALGAGDRYGGFAALGRYRRGLTDRLTAGFRFEYAPHVVSLGPSVDVALRAGLVHLGAGFSWSPAGVGRAFSLGYTYSLPRLSLGATATVESNAYSVVGQPPGTDRAVASLAGFASLQVGRRSTLSAQFLRRLDRDAGASTLASISDTLSLGRSLSLTISADRNTMAESRPQSAVVASLNVAFGRHDAVVSSRAGSDGAGTAIQVQQSAPGVTGWSYVGSVDRSATTVANAEADYRGAYGEYTLDYMHDARQEAGYDLRLTGGLALIGGGVYPSRAIDGGYVLVNVPGLAGVRVFAENQDVGKTNAKGRLLVPGLLAYYGNQLRIADDSIPLDVSVQKLQRTVAPPERGGVVVTFPVQRVRALVGRLVVNRDGKTIVPSFGDMSVDGNGVHVESAIGGNGEFYLEDVPSGSYAVTITFAGGTCRFALREPEEKGTIANLGTLTCSVRSSSGLRSQ